MLENIEETRDSYIEVIALVNCCYLYQFRSDLDALAENASKVMVLAEEKQFSTFGNIARIFHRWAKVRQGIVAVDSTDVLNDLTEIRESGALEDLCYYHGLVAEILASAGRTDGAVQLLNQAIEDAERTSERWYLAELYRLRGDLARGEAASSQADLELAIAVAHEQGARAWQLRAALSLHRLTGGDSETHATLESFNTWLTEGVDLPELQSVGALLGQKRTLA
jgi:predicted ATPase